MRALLLVAALAAPQAPEAEVKVVEYLKAHVKAGERVVVSQLYNEVFTADAERAALNRLFNTFFKLPLYMAQHQKAAGKPPTLAEISEQFSFHVPGEADVMLRIMESDPRMPKFITRDPVSGEIVSVDVDRRSSRTRASARRSSARSRAGRGGPRRPSRRPTTTASRWARPSSRASRTCSTSGSRTARPACGPHRCSRSSTGPTRRRASASSA